MALTQVASGLIASVAGSTITGSQSIPKSTLPTGSVLQVVQGTLAGGVSTTSNTAVDTGLTATITPSSSNSKIFVIFNHPVPVKQATNSDLNVNLVRNSTNIIVYNDSLFTPNISNNYGTAIGGSILDSPATTSAVTYKTQFFNGQGTSLQVFACSSGTSTIILMEISA